MKLSVVIPCFGRHQLIQECLRSVDPTDRAELQIVLVDDGSTPPLEPVVQQLMAGHDLVLRQENRGRASALREGILRASGHHVMLMDSDDEFIPGMLDVVLADIGSPSPADVVGYVYDCNGYHDDLPIGRLPSDITATLLGLRADHGVQGDLKEVVETLVVREALYPDPGKERRVPTSYIWAGVSMRGLVMSRSQAIVRHRYLNDGMTRSIRELKKENPYWLARTYHRIACAPRGTYRSRWFRFTYAAKALSVDGAELTRAHAGQLRESLGVIGYIAARISAMILRVVSR